MVSPGFNVGLASPGAPTPIPGGMTAVPLRREPAYPNPRTQTPIIFRTNMVSSGAGGGGGGGTPTTGGYAL